MVIFLISKEIPKVCFTRQIEYAYAIMDKQRKDSVPIIREYLHENGFLTCGRFGEWDYIWTDKVLLSGKYAAEKAFNIFLIKYKPHHIVLKSLQRRKYVKN